MKNKIIKSVIAITALLALSIGVGAVQIDFSNHSLTTKSEGSVNIRAGLYSIPDDSEYDYMAETESDIALGISGGVTKLKVRFPGTNGVEETRYPYRFAVAKGNIGTSVHYAWSDIDELVMYLPND